MQRKYIWILLFINLNSYSAQTSENIIDLTSLSIETINKLKSTLDEITRIKKFDNFHGCEDFRMYWLCQHYDTIKQLVKLSKNFFWFNDENYEISNLIKQVNEIIEKNKKETNNKPQSDFDIHEYMKNF